MLHANKVSGHGPGARSSRAHGGSDGNPKLKVKVSAASDLCHLSGKSYSRTRTRTLGWVVVGGGGGGCLGVDIPDWNSES